MHRDPLPRVDRPDAELVVVGTWATSSPDQQRAATDAAAEQWRHVDWPSGLLSHTAFASADGATVLHYSQAVGEQAFRDFAGKARWAAGVDAAAPGVERRAAVPYRLHRSVRTGADGEPGCVVAVVFDTENAECAESWIDAVTAAGREDSAPAGMLSAHFHVSLDGAHILNYAEWIDAESHEQAVEARPKVADTSSVVKVVDRTPGVRFAGVTRYPWWRSTATPTTS